MAIILFFGILITIQPSRQFITGSPGGNPNLNLLQNSFGSPAIVFQGRTAETDNEILHGSGPQDPNISPYWADSHGRQPNPVPHINFDIFRPEENSCERPAPCNASWPYRLLSGYCNNLLNPELGAAGQPMPRILPPSFDEGFMRRLSVTGSLLPNPRTVSLAARQVPPRTQTNHNMMLMQIGQFIDHDHVLIREIREESGHRKDCLDCASWRDPACAPIPIPSDDPYIPSRAYVSGRPMCLPFVRNVAVPGRDNFGHTTLEQVNSNSAFLDLSTVYGSDDCREKALRTFSYGQLIVIKQSREFLPGLLPLADATEFEECRSNEKKCFLAGDDRSNEHIGILTIHTLYQREHNRLATILHKVNPHWDDARLFEEARRINIAQYQHMIYSEFLPALIGIQKMTEYRLHPQKTGFYQEYNERVNPGVLNEFATSAFRVGHTMVPAHMQLLNENFLPVGSVSLLDAFHNISMAFHPGICDSVIRGFVGSRLEGVDLAMNDVLLNKLFEKAGVIHSGQDLFARNIARSREHGISSYLKYKTACGGGVVSSFDDLRRVMSNSAVKVLQQIYSNVDDIDLFIGGLAEDPVPGGLLGPTFACIIAYQFLNSRRGDRFWYENAAAGFTPAQLHSIRGASSLSRILCDNMDNSPEDKCNQNVNDARIPLRAYFIPSHIENPPWSCDRIPSTDLNLWKEHHIKEPVPCTYLGLVYQWNKIVHVSPCLHCICQPDGFLKCEPNPSGCLTQNRDEFCSNLCDESHTDLAWEGGNTIK